MDTQMLIGSRFEAGTETEEQVLNPRTGELIKGIPTSVLVDDSRAQARLPFQLSWE